MRSFRNFIFYLKKLSDFAILRQHNKVFVLKEFFKDHYPFINNPNPIQITLKLFYPHVMKYFDALMLNFQIQRNLVCFMMYNFVIGYKKINFYSLAKSKVPMDNKKIPTVDSVGIRITFYFLRHHFNFPCHTFLPCILLTKYMIPTKMKKKGPAKPSIATYLVP